MERDKRSFGQIYSDDARINANLASRLSEMQNWVKSFPRKISEQITVDRIQESHFEKHGDYLNSDSSLLHHR